MRRPALSSAIKCNMAVSEQIAFRDGATGSAGRPVLLWERARTDLPVTTP
jgi:hypothetical protein